MENVQRRVTRMIPILNKMSYTERMEKLRLSTPVSRRVQGNMTEVFKDFDVVSKDINPDISLNTSVARGHIQMILKQRCKKDMRKYNITHRLVNLWNELPNKVMELENILTFERNLDNHWMNIQL